MGRDIGIFGIDMGFQQEIKDTSGDQLGTKGRLMKAVLVVFLSLFALNNLVAERAPESFSDVRFALGGGVSIFGGNNSQVAADPYGYDLTVNLASGSVGFDGFFDLTQYVTILGGYRMAVGSYNVSASYGNSAANNSYSITVQQYELGVELKYPVYINSSLNMAPKIGLEQFTYTSGTLGGYQLSSDGKQMFSPLLLLLGEDMNFVVNEKIFVRVPFSIGFGLNQKLSSAYYEPDSKQQQCGSRNLC